MEENDGRLIDSIPYTNGICYYSFSTIAWFQVNEVELYIHTGIAKAISNWCKCKFPWHSSDLGSSSVGTLLMKWPTGFRLEKNKQTLLLQLLEECTESKPVLQVEKFGLWISQNDIISRPEWTPLSWASFRFHARNSTVPLSTKPDDIVYCHVHIARYVTSLLYIPVTVLANYS